MAIRPLTLIVFVCTLAGLDSGCGGGTNAPPSTTATKPGSNIFVRARSLLRIEDDVA